MDLGPGDAQGFAELAKALAAEPDDEHTVQRAVELAHAAIGGSDYAGFTSIRPDRLETAAATDQLIADLDEAQHQLGEGPCLEAVKDGHTFLIVDTRTETRWPRWCARASSEGIRGVLSVRLAGGQELQAALNLYSRQPDAFDDEDILTAEIYAAHAGAAIASSRKINQLTVALNSRHTIGVAQGLLMQRYGLTMEQTFAFLSRISQDQNTKLRDVAAKVIAQAGDNDGRLP